MSDKSKGTAAAKVGEWPTDELVADLVASATEEDSHTSAAAEVGRITVGDHKDLAMVEKLRDEVARLKDERAATIERCARVAEWEGYATVGRQIAAEIRALKDKPQPIDRRDEPCKICGSMRWSCGH